MTESGARKQLLDRGSSASFDGYRSTLSGYNSATPHAQGITDKGSFKQIVDDPNTLLAVDEGEIVPVLYDVDSADWFNVDHIRKVTGTDRLMALHTSPNLRDVVLTEEARALGGAFLSSGGLVVVSYPESDGDAHANSERLLSSLVPSVASRLQYVELGNQSYFQGEAVATDPTRWAEAREKTHALYADNPAAMIADAFFERPTTYLNNGINVRSYSQVPLGLTGEIYKFVEAAFAKINDHPCRQAWTETEFREIVEDTKSVVKVVPEKAGSAVALLAFGTRLEDFPWVEPEYWSAADRASGKNLYFPTAARNPSAAGAAALGSSIAHMSEVIAEVGPGIKIHFDTCDDNRDPLPKGIERAVERSGIHTLKFNEVANQVYGAFRVAA